MQNVLTNDGDLRTGKGATITGAPYFNIKALLTSFHERTVSANVVTHSNINKNYAHKAFN